MKWFAATFAALALLVALGQAVPLDTKDVPAAKTGTCPAPDAPVSLSAHGDSPSERKIREALNQAAQIDFVKTPLKDVVASLKELHHIEIQLDLPALKEAGVDESEPVTKHLKGISLRSALRMMLDDLQLKYVIHNEVLLFTSPTKAESDEYMETRAYPVTDLVCPERDGAVDPQPLKDMLTSTVATKTWVDNGGTGTESEIVVGNRLLSVVSQTEEVHEEIEETLDLIRKAGGLKTAAPRVALNDAAERQIRAGAQLADADRFRREASEGSRRLPEGPAPYRDPTRFGRAQGSGCRRINAGYQAPQGHFAPLDPEFDPG